MVIPARYDTKPYSFGFRRDSSLLRLFNHYLKQLRERGATKKILDDYEPREQVGRGGTVCALGQDPRCYVLVSLIKVCPDYSGKPLGFANCFTAFLVLILGLATAAALICLEKSLDVSLRPPGFSCSW